MPEESSLSKASGVQELIDRIRGEGVSQARSEAEEILRAAREEAAAILARAEQDAREMQSQTHAQIETEKAAGIAALENAARDALLEMKGNVRKTFEEHVARLVSTDTRRPEFIRSLVLVLAGHAAEQFINDAHAQIFVSAEMADQTTEEAGLPEEVQQKISDIILGIGGEVLREGVELLPDEKLTGGARVKLVGQKIEIDLSDQALTRALLKHLLPRYRQIVGDRV